MQSPLSQTSRLSSTPLSTGVTPLTHLYASSVKEKMWVGVCVQTTVHVVLLWFAPELRTTKSQDEAEANTLLQEQAELSGWRSPD